MPRRLVVLVLAASAAVGCASGGGGRVTPSSVASADDVEVGYGVQSRARITSAITSIFPTRTEAASVGRVEELLIGRAAGVEVDRTLSGGYSLRIRGAMANGGEPLIVLDGVPQPLYVPTELILAGINPADVRRIDILRGSSGSVYGMRGGNGVIVIERRPKPE